MKCVRTGSAQNTAQPFGEKQRVEKMTYNCEAGSGERLVVAAGCGDSTVKVLLVKPTDEELETPASSSSFLRKFGSGVPGGAPAARGGPGARGAEGGAAARPQNPDSKGPEIL